MFSLVRHTNGRGVREDKCVWVQQGEVMRMCGCVCVIGSMAAAEVLMESSGAPVIGLAFFFLTVGIVVAVLICWDIATPLAKAVGSRGSSTASSTPRRYNKLPKKFLRSSPYSLKPNRMRSSSLSTSKVSGKAKAAPVFKYRPPINRFRYFEYDVRVAEKMAFAEYVIVSTRF